MFQTVIKWREKQKKEPDLIIAINQLIQIKLEWFLDEAHLCSKSDHDWSELSSFFYGLKEFFFLLPKSVFLPKPVPLQKKKYENSKKNPNDKQCHCDTAIWNTPS